MQVQAFPYHWHHFEEYGATKLRIFCLSGKNESIYIEIDDFLPYIYIELPSDKTWSMASLSLIQVKLKELSFNSIVKMEFVSKKKLYFAKKDKTEAGEYVDKMYPFLKCFFKTSSNIRTFTYKIRQPIFFGGCKITLKTHESDANPVLQFMCMMDIKPASWFAFKGKKRLNEDERESLCDHEYACSYKHFAPIDNTGRVPARPYILSFDIEVNSNNPNVFPQASQPEDKVFQVSCVFARNGDPEEKFEKYILTLCKNKKGEIIELNMDKLGDGIEVLGYETESQLLEGFKDLVLEKNPQIICGYNIFSFDIMYIRTFKDVQYRTPIHPNVVHSWRAVQDERNQLEQFGVQESRIQVFRCPRPSLDRFVAHHSTGLQVGKLQTENGFRSVFVCHERSIDTQRHFQVLSNVYTWQSCCSWQILCPRQQSGPETIWKIADLDRSVWDEQHVQYADVYLIYTRATNQDFLTSV